VVIYIYTSKISCCWRDIFLNVRAPKEDESDDTKDSFHE